MKIFLLLCVLVSNAYGLSKKIDFPSGSKNRGDSRLYLPKNFKSKSNWPLIISLHGYTGSAKFHDNHVKLRKLVDKKGFVLLVPNGLKNAEDKRYWNASNYCCDFEKKKVNDVKFIENSVNNLFKKYKRIDLNKISVVGYSNGAFMAQKLACESNLNIKSIATISGTFDNRDANSQLINTNESVCFHERRIKNLHIHGTNDETIKYKGDDFKVNGYLGVDDYMNMWSLQNNCSKRYFDKDHNVDAFRFGKESEIYRWPGCEGSLVLYKVKKSPHFFLLKNKVVKEIANFLLD